MGYRNIRRALTALVLLAAAVVIWNLPMGNRETGKFVLKPLEHAQIRAPVAGFVTGVYFGEGEEVAEGSLIVRMEVPELGSEIARMRSQIAEVSAHLNSLGADVPADLLTTLTALVKSADEAHGIGTGQTRYVDSAKSLPTKGKVHEIEAELEYAQQRYQRAKILNRTKVASDDQLRKMEKDYRVWLNKYQQVLSEQEAEKARLTRLVEELTYLEATKEKLALRSPIEGIVTTSRIQALKGRYFEEGELILEIVDPSVLEAEVTIGEQNMSLIELGQRVVLKPFSLPYRTFEARAVRIAPVVQQPGGEQRQDASPVRSGELKVYCEIEQPDKALTAGMSGYARIYLSEQTFGKVVMGRLMRFIRTEFWW